MRSTKTYLRKMRELTGLTIRDASDRAGVSEDKIQAWEVCRTGTGEDIEAVLTVYFQRLRVEHNRELLK